MWFYESTFYQIAPFGLVGAPWQNDDVACRRLDRLESWIPHLVSLGVGAVYFTPLFQSDSHGYDTRTFSEIDCRLGTNADFAALCAALHGAGIRVVLDGVFNHVGRGFWAFRDVQQNRQGSRYAGWFHINWSGDSPYGDGFWYDGWEGNYSLVRLNLDNPEVVQHLLDMVRLWVSEFGIDGLRLDVAYLLPDHFLRVLRDFTRSLAPDFFLAGEIIHGDYNRLLNVLDSCTNYECYKGIHSSINSQNMFEIAHSLARQFGPEHWTLYKGRHLLSFVDNHDVSRIASQLNEPQNLAAAYTIMFAMPGIPCVYYGSEWGAAGEKSQGDAALRPQFAHPQSSALCDYISFLANAKKTQRALCYGTYSSLYLQSRQFVFSRQLDGARVVAAVNIDSAPCTLHGFEELRNLQDGTPLSTLAPHSAGLYADPHLD